MRNEIIHFASRTVFTTRGTTFPLAHRGQLIEGLWVPWMSENGETLRQERVLLAWLLRIALAVHPQAVNTRLSNGPSRVFPSTYPGAEERLTSDRAGPYRN
jgi:hypothetical protein